MISGLSCFVRCWATFRKLKKRYSGSPSLRLLTENTPGFSGIGHCGNVLKTPRKDSEWRKSCLQPSSGWHLEPRWRVRQFLQQGSQARKEYCQRRGTASGWFVLGLWRMC